MIEMKKACPKILVVDDDCDHSELLKDSLMLYYEMGIDSKVVVCVQRNRLPCSAVGGVRYCPAGSVFARYDRFGGAG